MAPAPIRDRLAAIRKVLRGRLVPALAIVAGLVAGPAFAISVFPEAPLVKQVVGGWIAGVYFALCAIPEYFLDL